MWVTEDSQPPALCAPGRMTLVPVVRSGQRVAKGVRYISSRLSIQLHGQDPQSMVAGLLERWQPESLRCREKQSPVMNA